MAMPMKCHVPYHAIFPALDPIFTIIIYAFAVTIKNKHIVVKGQVAKVEIMKELMDLRMIKEASI